MIKNMQIYLRQVLQYYARKTYKTGNLRVCWDLIQVWKFEISLIMTYQRAIRDVIFVSENCGMTCQKIEPFKILRFVLRAFNTSEKSPREEISGVCKKCTTKLAD